LALAPRLFRYCSILAIVLSIACAVAITLPDIPPPWRQALANAEALFTILFALEYAIRLWAAPEHPVYAGIEPSLARIRAAKTPAMILDLLGILPYLLLMAWPAMGGLALVLQVLRFLRLGRYSSALASVGRVLMAELRPLAASGMLGLATLLVSSTAMYLAERGAQPDKFSSIPATMYWGIVTLATVGYGDLVPLTPLGKLITGISILCGLILFALPIAIIATGFLGEIRRRDFIVTYGMVSRVPLFSGLGGGALAELVSMLKSRRVPKGVEVVRKNEPGDSMFFIASGEVEVALAGQNVRLAQGDFFGEMAVLGSVPRNATVTSRRTCELLVLDAADVLKFIEQHPGLAAPLREAAERRRG
jgi:voltage-gated potassium channel